MSSTLTAMKLKTGLDPLERVHIKDARGLRFHGMGAFVGTGRTQRAHVYTAASIPVDPEAYKKIDPEKLAHELGVDMCAVNSGRFWMIDELEIVVGEVQDFHGVEMRWAGDMTGAEMIAQFQSAYTPSLIYRNTNWIFNAGKPVYLLREPEGATWVLQEFTKDVDAEPRGGQPRGARRQLQGAAGGLDVRDEDPRRGSLAGHVSCRRLGSHHPRRVPLHLPGLRLRLRPQRELRAVNRHVESDRPRLCRGLSVPPRTANYVSEGNAGALPSAHGGWTKRNHLGDSPANAVAPSGRVRCSRHGESDIPGDGRRRAR